MNHITTGPPPQPQTTQVQSPPQPITQTTTTTRTTPAKPDLYGRRYRRLLSKVLLQRQQSLFIYSGVSVYVFIVTFRFLVVLVSCFAHVTEDACEKGGGIGIFAQLFSRIVLLSFFYIYFFGVLPILFLRKWYRNVSVRIEVEQTLWEEIRSLLSSSRTYTTVLIYTTSATVITWCFYQYLIQASFNRPMHVFFSADIDFKCPSFRRDRCVNDPRMLNEFLSIAMFNGTMFGVYYAFDYLIRRRYVLYFSDIELQIFQTPTFKDWWSVPKVLWQNKGQLFQRFRYWLTARFTLPLDLISKVGEFTFAYWIWHTFFWKSTYNIIATLLRPFHVTVYEWLSAPLFDSQLFSRGIFCALFTLNCWTMAHRLFEYFFTRAIISGAPNELLVNGLSANMDPYIQNLAFLELWHIAKTRKAIQRRTEIYHEFDKNSWQIISRACIEQILGLAHTAHQQLARQKKINDDIRKWKVMIKNDEIDRSSEETWVVRKHKKDKGKGRKEPPLVATQSIFNQSEDVKRVSTIQKQPEYWDLVWFQKFVEGSWVYRSIVFPLKNRTIERRTLSLMKNKQIVTFAIEALAALAIDSLTLDTYGVVQRDISKIFEVMLDCLLSLEEYCRKPPLYPWDNHTPSKVNARILVDVLGVVNILKEALYNMSDNFRDHMTYVTLPTAHFDRFEKLINERM